MFQKLFNKGRAATLLFILSLSSCSFVNHTSAFPIPRQPKPNLFRGVFHVHSEYSHDSKASLNLITKTARKAGLDFVVIPRREYETVVRSESKKKNKAFPAWLRASVREADEGHTSGPFSSASALMEHLEK